ncbi:class I tRNA ligase family protein, partial [Enterococcus faecalis]|uniref:class I tRNA ligase family protein n=3 Tax=Bacteria TaxID=2 RepID=UPI003D6B2FED
ATEPLKETPVNFRAFVADTEEEAVAAAEAYYGAGVAVTVGDQISFDAKSVVLRRDPDVLDTWFSSALWPFATLGWP